MGCWTKSSPSTSPHTLLRMGFPTRSERLAQTTCLPSSVDIPNRRDRMTASTNAEYTAHDHVFLGAAHDRYAQRTLWVVGLTAVMMIAAIIAGYVTGTMALLSDGFHIAIPAGALSLAAAAYCYPNKHPNNPKF